GRALAETLGKKNVALMRGHGNVCVGSNIMTAVYRAVYTEVNARLQAQAIALGADIVFMDPQECALITGRKDLNFDRPWRMWKERIGAKEAEGWRADAAVGGPSRLRREARNAREAHADCAGERRRADVCGRFCRARRAVADAGNRHVELQPARRRPQAWRGPRQSG